MTDNDKISIYERYSAGELSEDAARVLLGDEFDLLQEDINAFREAAEETPVTISSKWLPTTHGIQFSSILTR